MSSEQSRRRFLAGVGTAATTMAIGPTTATTTATATTPRGTPTQTTTDPISTDALQSFFDNRLPEQLEEHDIAGATVSVVADGERRLSEGYGLADVAAEEPVKANETLFRIGSVSKSLTGTAVMRGVEAGRLSLETDVREYVDGLSFPGEYNTPITLEHLGTHTAGLRVSSWGCSPIPRNRCQSLKQQSKQTHRHVCTLPVSLPRTQITESG